MTPDGSFDRRLTAWLEEDAAPRAPQGFSEALTESVDRKRQLPGWATPERWISMETRAMLGAVPRALALAATLILLTALVAGAIVVGSSSGPTLPAPFGAAGNGLIAFEYEGDIYVAAPDGSDRRQLTSGREQDSDPAWSRDGMSLAYHSVSEDGSEASLKVTDADGRDPITLVTTQPGEAAIDRWIEWSADSTEIMYNAVDPEVEVSICTYQHDAGGRCGSRLWVVPADGSGPPRQVGDPDLDARGPELSPDGVTVAFGGGDAGSQDLYLMDWDGSNVRKLETGEFTGYTAHEKQSWSADGARVATNTDGNSWQDIWLMDADGSDATMLTDRSNRSASHGWPRFAPDGSGMIWGWFDHGAESFGTTFWTPDGGLTSLENQQIRSWSPDAQLLEGWLDGELVVYDRQGEVIARLGPADEAWGTERWQRVAP